MNAVTCATWLKRGTLSTKPKKYIASAKSIKSLSYKTNIEKNDLSDQNELNKIINEYDLDDYSSDDDSSLLQNMSTFLENKNDPYMKEFIDQNENSSSEEDNIISQSDELIVVGKTHRDYHSLEVWIANKDEHNHISTYCHHDYILTSCPLDISCLSNISVNLAAVGTLTPIIQLWDLDAMNVVDPVLTLGSSEKDGHSDAVLTLSNKFVSQNSSVLLSGSADKTVVLWSIKEGEGRCVQKSSLGHSDKIQSIQWHPIEDSIFATGSFDEMVHIYDCRTCFHSKKPDCKWTVDGEVEKIIWDIHRPFNIFAASSSGSLHYFDIRMVQPIWLLNAHNPASTSCIAQCNFNDNCIITTSNEGKVKVWNARKSPAELVTTKSYKIGSIFCVTPCPEEPMNFCVGGEREMKIIDLKKDTKIREYFLAVDKEHDNNNSSFNFLKETINSNKIECPTSKNLKELKPLSNVYETRDTSNNLTNNCKTNLVKIKKTKKRKKNTLDSEFILDSTPIRNSLNASGIKDNNEHHISKDKNKPIKNKRNKKKLK